MLLEWCADLFGATKRSRWRPFLVTLAIAIALTALFVVRWGFWRGILPLAALLIAAPLAAQRVIAARGELWRAACFALTHPAQRPTSARDGRLLGPTATALVRLALAVDAARRGDYMEANGLAQVIDRALLRPDEMRLLDAVRAMISLGMGDEHRAAQQAIVALPTGSEPLDTELGRAAVASAWSSPKQLAAIDEAWSKAGIHGGLDTGLARLRSLVRLRLREDAIEALPPAEAHALAEEARRIGDERLAWDLDARARASAYR